VATDYGLAAMTGVIPVTMMAGVNVAVIKELFPERYGKKRKTTRRRSRKSRRTNFGDFSNSLF